MPRVFQTADGLEWSVERISHGNTSAYLNRRVHKPLLRFKPVGRRGAARYVGCPPHLPELVEELTVAQVQDLLERATVH